MKNIDTKVLLIGGGVGLLIIIAVLEGTGVILPERGESLWQMAGSALAGLGIGKAWGRK